MDKHDVTSMMNGWFCRDEQFMQVLGQTDGVVNGWDALHCLLLLVFAYLFLSWFCLFSMGFQKPETCLLCILCEMCQRWTFDQTHLTVTHLSIVLAQVYQIPTISGTSGCSVNPYCRDPGSSDWEMQESNWLGKGSNCIPIWRDHLTSCNFPSNRTFLQQKTDNGYDMLC